MICFAADEAVRQDTTQNLLDTANQALAKTVPVDVPHQTSMPSPQQNIAPIMSQQSEEVKCADKLGKHDCDTVDRSQLLQDYNS